MHAMEKEGTEVLEYQTWRDWPLAYRKECDCESDEKILQKRGKK